MKVNIQELRALMKYHNRLQKDVAKAIGISRNTFALKLQSGDFKVSEIHKLIEVVPMTMQDVIKVFFAE